MVPLLVLPFQRIKPIIFSVAPVEVVLKPTYDVLPEVASKKKITASLAESPGIPNTL